MQFPDVLLFCFHTECLHKAFKSQAVPWKPFCALTLRLLSSDFHVFPPALLDPSSHTWIFFYLLSFHASLHSWKDSDFLRLPCPHSETSYDFLLLTFLDVLILTLGLPLLHPGTFTSSSLLDLPRTSFSLLWDFLVLTLGPSQTSSSLWDFLLSLRLPHPHSGTSSSSLWDLFWLLPPLHSRLPHLCSSYFCHWKQLMLQCRVYSSF